MAQFIVKTQEKKYQKKLRYKRGEDDEEKGMAEVLPSHIEFSATDSILVI